MNLEEFKSLTKLKHQSNVEFHADKQQTVEQAIKELDTLSFSDLEGYKPALQKMMYALEKLGTSKLYLDSILPYD